MRSAATTLVRGRHRMGRPGLVHVTAFVTVIRRGMFASWRIPGRHRWNPATAPTWAPPGVPTAGTAAPATPAMPRVYAV